jgi:hypothetical protein
MKNQSIRQNLLVAFIVLGVATSAIVCPFNSYAQEIEDIVIPAYEDLPLNPTLKQMETAITNFGTLDRHVISLEIEVRFKELKRDLAKIAFDSVGITRSRNLRRVVISLILEDYGGAIKWLY